MAVYYYIIQLVDNQRVIYRDTYFDSLKSARQFAKTLANAVEIGRANSQGYLFYKL